VDFTPTAIAAAADNHVQTITVPDSLVNNGDKWSVTVSNSGGQIGSPVTTTAGNSDTSATVAQALAVGLDALSGVVAFAFTGDNTIYITQASAASFTLTVTYTPSGGSAVDESSNAAVVNTNPTGVTTTVAALQTVPIRANDVWSATLSPLANGSGTYTVGTGNAYSDIANGLATSLNTAAGHGGSPIAGTHAENQGAKLVIFQTSTSDSVAMSINLEGVAPSAQPDAVFTLTGPVWQGDTWKITLDATHTKSFSVAASSMDPSAVVTGLTNAVNAPPGNYIAAMQGDQVFVTNGSAFGATYPQASIDSGGGSSSNTTTAKTVTLTGPGNDGDTWTLTVNGVW
jgi:hypothetical protein